MSSACLTPGAVYQTHDGPRRVEIAIDLPAGVALSSNQHGLLHDAAQLGLAAALAADGKPSCSAFAAAVVAARILQAFPPEDD